MQTRKANTHVSAVNNPVLVHDSMHKDINGPRAGRLQLHAWWKDVDSHELQLLVQENNMRIGFKTEHNQALDTWLRGRGLCSAIMVGEQPVWNQTAAEQMLMATGFFKPQGQGAFGALDALKGGRPPEQRWPSSRAFGALARWGSIHGHLVPSASGKSAQHLKLWEAFDWLVTPDCQSLAKVSETHLKGVIAAVKAAEITLSVLAQAPGPYALLSAAVPSADTKELIAGDGKQHFSKAWTSAAGYVSTAGRVLRVIAKVSARGVELTYTVPAIPEVQSGDLDSRGVENIHLLPDLPAILTKDHGYVSHRGKNKMHSFLEMYLNRPEIQAAHGAFFAPWAAAPMDPDEGFVRAAMLHMHKNPGTRAVLDAAKQRQADATQALLTMGASPVVVKDAQPVEEPVTAEADMENVVEESVTVEADTAAKEADAPELVKASEESDENLDTAAQALANELMSPNVSAAERELELLGFKETDPDMHARILKFMPSTHAVEEDATASVVAAEVEQIGTGPAAEEQPTQAAVTA